MRLTIFLMPSLWLIAGASPLLAAFPTNDQPTTHIRFNTPAEADAKRQQLIDYIWAAGLPISTLPAVTPNIAFPGDLTGITQSLVSGVDELDANVSGMDFHSISYLLHPKNTANANRLVVVHQGHCHAADRISYGIADTANRLLQEGYSVIVQNMPLNGWNTDNTIAASDGATITIPGTFCQGHDAMFRLLSPAIGEGAVFRLFLEPVVQNINYFNRIMPGLKHVSMIGLSGGGWTTSMMAAMDSRIALSIPVAGSAPLYIQNRIGTTGDTEQILATLFNEQITPDGNGGGVATWLEIYVLGGYGAGRRQIMVTIPQEDVGLFPTTWVTDTICGTNVKSIITDSIKNLGSGCWEQAYDNSSPRHQISSWTIDNVIMPALAAAQSDSQIEYAKHLLAMSKTDAEIRVCNELKHREAFRVLAEDGKRLIECGSPAGAIYGAVAVARNETSPGEVEKPDFDIRGTTLWLGGAVRGGCMAPYYAGFDAARLPWFFDRDFMTRYLNLLTAARYNTIFVWASHPFPYLLELPEYPGATKLTPDQLRRNQEQFRWFTSECARRNIQVLLHFYNIHLPEGLAKTFNAGPVDSWGASSVEKPTPEIARYYKYVLGRYFQEFESVGLYICPGETLATGHQLEWFRDVIFAAARESGKNPLLVLRDWTMDMQFREQIRDLYENCYSELKHNDESFTSPVPDRRHERWRGILKGHVINLHGPPMDLQPMRWGSPLLIRETVDQWRGLGFVMGAEVYALSCFDWPITQDKLEPNQFGYRQQVTGRTLLWIDRDSIYLDAFGRYLWRGRRDDEAEREYWQKYLAEKFHSPEAGRFLYQWYVLTGPISPGIQNLTAVIFGNCAVTAMLQNQGVDQILTARKQIDDVPVTLTKPAGLTRQLYYSQPVDQGFFDRYRARYDLPNLTERLSMPVAQYAHELAAGRTVTDAMTPDKVCDLLCDMAVEALEAARAAQAVGTTASDTEELQRFVTDSELYLLAAKAFRHKVQAAILKARMVETRNTDLAAEFQKHMDQSVAVYEELARLTSRTYRNGNELMGSHWNKQGLAEFQKDQAAQQQWLKEFTIVRQSK